MVVTQHNKPEMKGKLQAAIFDMDGVVSITLYIFAPLTRK